MLQKIELCGVDIIQLYHHLMDEFMQDGISLILILENDGILLRQKPLILVEK